MAGAARERAARRDVSGAGANRRGDPRAITAAEARERTRVMLERRRAVARANNKVGGSAGY